jgi:hypothetical protein
MKDELIKLLPDLKKALEQGVAYAGDLFNRAVMFYKIETIVFMAIEFVFLLFTPKFIKWIIAMAKYENLGYSEQRESEEDETRLVIFGVFGVIGCITSFVFAICFLLNISEIIQLYTIPEIYILQVITQSI